MTPESLRSYRLSTGRNLRQFGEYLGVTPQCVSQWEQGRYIIPTWALKLIYALKTIEEIQQRNLPLPIPEGLCACGCGQETVKNWRNDTSKGWVKGKYRAYVKGHNSQFERVK
jgi:hypothetical protein